MTYDLFIGDRTYSSWSLRGWLLFDRFGIPVRTTNIDFLAGSPAGQLTDCAPARTVPCLRTPEGTLVWDSLAIAEELASRHPKAGFWPKDPAARATARSLAAEMHSGFGALRNDCPMNLRVAYADVPVDDRIAADLHRLEEIWDYARAVSGADGPWLCGSYSIADVWFAPVAARIAGYSLPVSTSAAAYVAAHLADPSFRRWRAMAQVRGHVLPWYERNFGRTDWPGPVPVPARAVEEGPSVNDTCPYSGDPVTDFAEIAGVIVGFCNPFCRDKTVADPEAWPAAVKVYQI